MDPSGQPPRQPARRVVLLGRDPGNDIVVRSPSVSARHARVVVDEGGPWLEDLGSLNGPFVGTPPRRIERTPRIGVDYAGAGAKKPLRFVVDPANLRTISPSRRTTP